MLVFSLFVFSLFSFIYLAKDFRHREIAISEAVAEMAVK